jgi:tetratricopeptide (TPR) repeat protein
MAQQESGAESLVTRLLRPGAASIPASVGLVALLGLITGQPVEAFGIKVSPPATLWVRWVFGTVGLLLLFVAAAILLWPHRHLLRLGRPTPTVPRPMLSPRFTGRKALLTDLRRKLRRGPTVLFGMAGVGKTQLVLAYLDRYKKSYTRMGWLRAEHPATLAGDYTALADRLGLQEGADPNQGNVIAAVRRWLADNSGWLLIFDNVERTIAVRDYLPEQISGHVLLTSRNPDWREFSKIEVKPWSREESLEFLQHAGPADKEVAETIADALGDLPLALEQALAYIDETKISLADYLELLRNQRPELLVRGQAHDYQKTVGTTWRLALASVEQHPVAAAELLNLCAFLDPEGIPRDLPHRRSDKLPEPLSQTAQDPIRYNDAVQVLSSYSLASVSRDDLSVHRLVQTAVRQHLGSRGERSWCEVALNLLQADFPSNCEEVETWPTCKRLLPHVLAACTHAEHLEVARAATGWLLDRAAAYIGSRGQYHEAKGIAERALRVTLLEFESKHQAVGKPLFTLATILRELSELDEAEIKYRDALAIYDANEPETVDPFVARILNGLGIVLEDRINSIPEARAADRRALEIQARSAHERALEIREAVYGPENPAVAASLTNLGNLSYHTGSLDKARGYHERALTINEQAYGPNHVRVAKSLNNLGVVLEDQNELARARDVHRRALQINERIYGLHHPEVAMSLNNLGRVLRKLNVTSEAKAVHERALAIRERTYGPHHPRVATSLHDLGLVLKDLGDLVAARSALERALAIREMRHDPAAAKTRASLEELREGNIRLRPSAS